MTFHGSIDHLFNPAANRNAHNEMYVSIYNFLTTSVAQGLGIERVAYSTGSGAQTMGTDFWDGSRPAGQNSWSCWRFLSASNPFYLLLQVVSGGGGFGASPGNPARLQQAAGAAGCVGAMYAILSGGGNPWNGTTRNDGTDVKGVPVWTSASAPMHVFPRSNSIGGSSVKQKDNMIQLAQSNITPTIPIRFHLICDENNVFTAFDSSDNGSYAVSYFGKFTPRSGSSHPVPYLLVNNSSDGDPGPIAINTTIGSVSGATGTEAGIAHYSWMSGTKTLIFDTLNTVFFSTTMQPNAYVSPSVIDEFPMYVGMSEFPNHFGYAGLMNMVRYLFRSSSNDTNADLTRAFLGGTAGTVALSIPWNGVTVPSSTATRLGVQF